MRLILLFTACFLSFSLSQLDKPVPDMSGAGSWVASKGSGAANCGCQPLKTLPTTCEIQKDATTCKNRKQCTSTECYNSEKSKCWTGTQTTTAKDGQVVCPINGVRCGSPACLTRSITTKSGVLIETKETYIGCTSDTGAKCYTSSSDDTGSTSASESGVLSCEANSERCADSCFADNQQCIKSDNSVGKSADSNSLVCAKNGQKRCGFACFATEGKKEKCYSAADKSGTVSDAPNGKLICPETHKLCHAFGTRPSWAGAPAICATRKDTYCFNPTSEICISGTTVLTENKNHAIDDSMICLKNQKRCGYQCMPPNFDGKCWGKDFTEQDVGKHHAVGQACPKGKPNYCGGECYDKKLLRCFVGTEIKDNVWDRADNVRLCNAELVSNEVSDCNCPNKPCTTTPTACDCTKKLSE